MKSIYIWFYMYTIILMHMDSIEMAVSKVSKVSCKEVDEMELELMLLDEEIDYLENLKNFNLSLRKPNQKYSDNTECRPKSVEYNNNNTTKSSQECRMKKVVKTYEDQYPFKQIEMKCTCDKCFNKKNKKASCRPVFELRVILLKKSCGKNGIYNLESFLKPMVTECKCIGNN